MPVYRLSLALTFTNIDDVAARDQLVLKDDAVMAAARAFAATIKGGEKRVAMKLSRVLRDKPPRKLWGETL